jgi:hypothetical protein
MCMFLDHVASLPPFFLPARYQLLCSLVGAFANPLLLLCRIRPQGSVLFSDPNMNPLEPNRLEFGGGMED